MQRAGMAEKTPSRPQVKLQDACSRTRNSVCESVTEKDLYKRDKPPPTEDTTQLAQGDGPGKEEDDKLERWESSYSV